MKIYIYGIYSEGRCRYVGRTKDPEKRMAAHKVCRFYGVDDARMRIFRTASVNDGPRIEAQIMTAFWKRGEADKSLNGGRVIYRRLKKVFTQTAVERMIREAVTQAIITERNAVAQIAAKTKKKASPHRLYSSPAGAELDELLELARLDREVWAKKEGHF